MALRDLLITKAQSLKTSVDEVEAAFTANDIEAAKTAFTRLHGKPNGLASRAADHFGGDISTFSGGTDPDKPEDPDGG